MDGLTWWEGLLQLFSLFPVLDDKCVQVLAASNLELNVLSILLDLYSCNTNAIT